jgi:uncharacterized membrane protein
MTVPSLRRARLWGALLIAGAFALGVWAGVAWASRPRPGMTMTFVASDEVPSELTRLGLSESERQQIRQILRNARPRVLAVMAEFDPKMRAAVEQTEREIAAVLDPAHRAAWEDYRRRNPAKMEQRLIGR